MGYEIQYDKGEYCPLPETWVDEDDEREPVPNEKDKFATNSVAQLLGKSESLKNLYELDYESEQRAVIERRQYLLDLQHQRKKHLVIKHGSANVVGSQTEPWASQGVIKIKEPRQIEADDDIAQKVRDEKQREKIRHERIERELKEKMVKDKQRCQEIENINRELEKGQYTYDFQGNVILQNTHVIDQIPQDFKFRYKFKKGRRGQTQNQKQQDNYGGFGRKKNVVPFEESKQTGKNIQVNLFIGSVVSDYAKLSKLCDHKTITNIKQTAGSMFEFFQPNEYGIYLRENARVKYSKKDYEDVIHKMSLENYQRKVNNDGNFISNMIHPEINFTQTLQPRPMTTQEQLAQMFPKSQTLQVVAQSIKQDIDSKKDEIREQNEYLMKLRDEFQEAHHYLQMGGNQNIVNDKHIVVVKSPEFISELIAVPRKSQSLLQQHMQKQSFLGMNVSQQSSIGIISSNSKNLSQKDLHKRQPSNQTVKNQDVTEDLFKLQRNSQSEKQLQTLQQNTLECKSLFDQMNEIALNKNGWGQNNYDSGLPSLKYGMSTKTNYGKFSASGMNLIMNRGQSSQKNRISTAATGNRPITRASLQSSQQSMRSTLTHSGSAATLPNNGSNQKSHRRNLQLISQKFHKDEPPKHLAQPPLGKTLGHGLIQVASTSQLEGSTQQRMKSLMGGVEASANSSLMIRKQMQVNNNHLMVGQLSGKHSFKSKPSEPTVELV